MLDAAAAAGRDEDPALKRQKTGKARSAGLVLPNGGLERNGRRDLSAYSASARAAALAQPSVPSMSPALRTPGTHTSPKDVHLISSAVLRRQ